MDLGLSGKVAIIAGASRGIGRATALTLAEEGCRLALAARGAEALREVVAEADAKGGEAIAVPGDLTQAADAERLVETTIERFGRVQILVTSMHFSVPAEHSDDVWRQSFEALFLPAARLTRLAVPHMRSAGGGSIVHLGSIYGREAGGRPGYNAMKAGIISHAKASSIEFAPDNIRVNSVASGSIAAPGGTWWKRREEDPESVARFVKDNIPMGRFGTAEEVANVVAFLCSPCASWVTGACWVVDGGQGRSNI